MEHASSAIHPRCFARQWQHAIPLGNALRPGEPASQRSAAMWLSLAALIASEGSTGVICDLLYDAASGLNLSPACQMRPCWQPGPWRLPSCASSPSCLPSFLLPARLRNVASQTCLSLRTHRKKKKKAPSRAFHRPHLPSASFTAIAPPRLDIPEHSRARDIISGAPSQPTPPHLSSLVASAALR